MECKNCGNKSFFDYQIQSGCFENIGKLLNINSKVCSKCGHIELFVTDNILVEHNNSVKEAKEIEELIVSKKENLKKLKKELEKANSIANDESKPYKEVVSAQQIIPNIEKQITTLSNEINQLELSKN